MTLFLFLSSQLLLGESGGGAHIQECFCVPQAPVFCLHSEKDDNCLHFPLPTVRLEEGDGWEGALELQASL